MRPLQARLQVDEILYAPSKYEDKSGTDVPRYPNISQDCVSTMCETIRGFLFAPTIII